MKYLELILSLGGTALGLLITSLAFFIKFIKNAKAKRFAEQITKIGNAILPYIKQAESFVNFSGAEKKEFVITKANQYAIENKIKFNAQIVSQKIEELVTLTKEVNQREKDNIFTAQYDKDMLIGQSFSEQSVNTQSFGDQSINTQPFNGAPFNGNGNLN